MPESRTRRKRDFTPTRSTSERGAPVAKRWVAPVMVACFLVGLAWIVVYYLAGQEIPPMRALGNWNLAIGMGLFIVGFAFATQWR